MNSRNTSFSNVLLLALHYHRCRKALGLVLQCGVLGHVSRALLVAPTSQLGSQCWHFLVCMWEPCAVWLGAVTTTQQERLRADCSGLCLGKIWLSVWKLRLWIPSWTLVPALCHSHKPQWRCVLLLCPVAGASAVPSVPEWDLNPWFMHCRVPYPFLGLVYKNQ